ncbi:hypothetical protein HDU76_008204, partial [Blyttiomyces sp. JEL0837]
MFSLRATTSSVRSLTRGLSSSSSGNTGAAAASSLVAQNPRGKEIFEADAVSGVPPTVTRRSVRIYRPANTPTQSGSARPNHWRIDFDVQQRWENPLMGWASSGDPVQAVGVKFVTKEDAILFAERQGYDYWVDLPKEGIFKVKQYAENFKVQSPDINIVAVGKHVIFSIMAVWEASQIQYHSRFGKYLIRNIMAVSYKYAMTGQSRKFRTSG